MSRLSNVHTVSIATAGTALATRAASMSSGTWAQMSPTPTGLNLFGNSAWFAADATGYATKMARDPNNKRIYYIGGDHNTPVIFVVYDEATNTWTNAHNGSNTWTFPVVPWGPQSVGGSPPSHGYEHQIYDSTRNKVWHRPFNDYSLRRWEGGTTWTTFSYSGTVNFGITCGACYFPELDRIILYHPNGNVGQSMVMGINPASPGSAPTIYANPLSGTEWYGCAHYSAIHQRVVLVGGTASGGDNNKVWTLNSSGVVTQLSGTSPGALGMIGPGETGMSMPFINPLNGHLICIKDSTVWHECNILTGVWTVKSGAVSVLSGRSSPFGVFGCTVSDYNIVVFIRGDPFGSGGPGEMWLYKP